MVEIQRRLDEIYELYTPERIEKSKQRFLALEKGELPKDRYPFCLEFPYFNGYNINHPPRERITAYLEAYRFQGLFDDDTIPYIFPGLNNATIPSMFGAEEIRCGMETTSGKLIRTIQDIYKLPQPSIQKGSAAERWIEAEQYLLEKTRGRIPITVCDMQGPFDACAQIWSYDEMFVAAYEEAEAFHEIISKLTDAFILLWNRQKEILGDVFMGTHLFSQGWVPKNCGAAVSADSLVMVSPDFYNEFYKPYLERIYRELGDLTIHSCGDFRHVVKKLCQTQGVKAINASQLTAQELYKAGVDSKIQLLLAISFDQLEEEMQFIKEHSLNVELCVYGVMPFGAEKAENPQSWTEEDIKTIQERVEIIQELMRVER